jgi:hypothetical protein
MPERVADRARAIRQTIVDPTEDDILSAVALLYESAGNEADIILLGHVTNPDAVDDTEDDDDNTEDV